MAPRLYTRHCIRYLTKFSYSMKQHRKSLEIYIDAIYDGTLETVPLALNFTSNEALAQLSTDNLLERCSELTQHLQQLHQELAQRNRNTVTGCDTASLYCSNLGFEGYHETSGDSITTVATQSPTALTSEPHSPQHQSGISQGKQLRNMNLTHWPVEEDNRPSNSSAYQYIRQDFSPSSWTWRGTIIETKQRIWSTTLSLSASVTLTTSKIRIGTLNWMIGRGS
jgi:hypothetical protein